MLVFANSEADAGKDVMEFVKLLQEEARPTVADFYAYFGQGNESEIELEFTICKKNGWIPPEKNPQCLAYHHKRFKDGEQEKSYYFTWLKKKIPSNPIVKISRVAHFRKKDEITHDLIYAKLNDVPVVFWRTVGEDVFIAQFGKFGLSSIGGRRVYDLLKEDMQSGYCAEEE